jgi:hypothetical protein
MADARLVSSGHGKFKRQYIGMITDQIYSQEVWFKRCYHPVSLFESCLHGVCALFPWALKDERVAVLRWGILVEFICDAPHVDSWIMQRAMNVRRGLLLANSLQRDTGSVDDRQRGLFSRQAVNVSSVTITASLNTIQPRHCTDCDVYDAPAQVPFARPLLFTVWVPCPVLKIQ